MPLFEYFPIPTELRKKLAGGKDEKFIETSASGPLKKE